MRVFALVAACLALAGCISSKPPTSTADLTVVNDATLPAPAREDLVAPDRQSLVGPLDEVKIDVFGVPEMSREVTVDASGRVLMPLIGAVDARGKTTAELADEIENKLRGRYIRNPDVTVNITDSVSQVVTVDGQVTQPGLYPVTNQMTLMRAVASARGLAEYARLEDVIVLRTVGSRRMAGVYNLGAIRRGAYADPPVYANDVVIVGDSPQRRLFRDLIAASPILTAPLILLTR